MQPQELRLGCLVRAKQRSPLFRQGALFRVVSLLEGPRDAAFVACRAVGIAPFRVWYFRILDLEPAHAASAAR